ncbi:MAG: hypothetical protein QOG30_1665 [Acidimicrobiaceae bacterium]
MGLLKSIKDMKATVHAAPEMITQAQQLGANAQQMAAQNQAALAAQQTAAATPGTVTGPDFEPIAGVSIALYAQISKGLAAVNYDQARAPEIAMAHGVTGANWAAAVEGWNARMQTNPDVGKQFNALYTQG